MQGSDEDKSPIENGEADEHSSDTKVELASSEEYTQPRSAQEARMLIGEILKQARLKEGRNLEDVAYEMNVPRNTLSELESGSLYDRMNKVFVRGYILSYAKILKQDEAHILEILDIAYRQEEGSPSRLAKAPRRSFMTDYERETMHKKEKTTLLSILLPILLCTVALVLLVYWRFFADAPAEITLEEQPVPEFHSASSSAPNELEESVVQVQSEIPENQLEFTFTEESWLEVTDSLGKQAAWQLYSPGEKVLFEGMPPYKVVVGNVFGTQVLYGGAELNLKTRARNNVARVEIPLQ